jgi:hypothetical protein
MGPRSVGPQWGFRMGNVFVWLNDQLLRMQWLSDLTALLVRDGFGLDPASQVGGSVHL